MKEQIAIITLTNKNNDNILGKLYISAENNSNKQFEDFQTPKMEFINVQRVQEPDEITPIQYCKKSPLGQFSRIMLLEETPYQIKFVSNNSFSEKPEFKTLKQENENNNLIFQEWRLSQENNRLEGTLNFHSYVGKSFFNIKIGNIESNSHPFEVRSKKIGYHAQYPAMIGDLSRAATGLILESKSPLYQNYDFSDKRRHSYYEDFMFIEYLFKSENLPNAYEYIRRNLYNRLEQIDKEIHSSLTRIVTPADLVNMVSKSENLQQTKNLPKNWPKKMKNFFPVRINQKHLIESIDTPENRLLKHFLLSIESIIIDIQKHVPNGYIKDKVDDYNQILEEYLSDDWLMDVGPLQFIPSNSQVLQKREGYRSIFQFFLNLEFAFRFEWAEITELLKGYNRRLSEIYEYWCYFKFTSVLSSLANIDNDFERLFEKRGGRHWSLKMRRGNSSKQYFHIDIEGKAIDVILWYNKRFSRRTRYPSYSLSFKPDYTLLVKSDYRSFFIHFDAKYRSEEDVLDFYNKIGSVPICNGMILEESFSEKDEIDSNIDERDKKEEIFKKFKDGDIYKMHTYKDAILRSEGAYIFYPGGVEKTIFKVKNYKEIPSVGAFPLTPGKNDNEENELRSFILAILKKHI